MYLKRRGDIPVLRGQSCQRLHRQEQQHASYPLLFRGVETGQLSGKCGEGNLAGVRVCSESNSTASRRGAMIVKREGISLQPAYSVRQQI